MAARRIVLDVETRSVLDLKKVGATRYAAHPTTDVWCAGYAIDNGPRQRWLPGEPLPDDLLQALADGATVVAHNAGFERAIWREILSRYGWPEILIERWCCTQARCLALALPPKLALAAKALELPEQKGDASIVTVMSKPRRPRGDEDPTKIYWQDDPELLQKLYDYNGRDVETERALDQCLPPLSDVEQALWCTDQIINDRGFYVDGAAIDAAIDIVDTASTTIQAELRQITGGALTSTNQTEKTLAWLAAHECKVKDLQKATLAHALRRTNLSPTVRRVIELRQEAAHASASKALALRAWRHVDGRVRGTFKFHGAATGRWSGSGPQPQNFPRESEDTEAKLAALMARDLEALRRLGGALKVISEILRTMLCAPPAKRLLGGDLSGIESRILAWVADQLDKVELWAAFDRTKDPDADPYVVIGRALGHPETNARKYGKIADLAFGYQGGAGAYKNFAPEDDTATAEQIEGFKSAWRKRHPQVVQFWHGINQAVIAAVRRAPDVITYGRLTLHCEQIADKPFLFITLPSGRRLSYPCAKIIANDRNLPAVTFMDNALGGWRPCGWQRKREDSGTYGGMLTENIVSGIGRDALAHKITQLEAAGYPVVLHVHDEIVCEVPNGEGGLAEFKYMLERPIPWADGLPIVWNVREGPRFAEVDTPVNHVAGVIAAAAPPARVQRKSKPAPPAGSVEPVPLDPGIVADMAAFAIEREAVRVRKEQGQPQPWTDNKILAAGRFCNIRREDDRGTRWVTTNIVEPCRDDPDLFFKITMARCINEPAALAEIDWRVPVDLARDLALLKAREARGEKVLRPDAYKPPLPPKKGDSTLRFLFEDVLAPMWRDRETLRPQAGETLQAYSDLLEQCYRIGPFLAGQIIADLKHVEPLCPASDWRTFVAPGPGSKRGLNWVCARPVKTAWSRPQWLATLRPLREQLNARLVEAGIAALDAQNVQNVLCEFDKYKRAEENDGVPSRKYRAAKPATKKAGRKSKRAPEPTAEPPTLVEQQIQETTAPQPQLSSDGLLLPGYVLDDAEQPPPPNNGSDNARSEHGRDGYARSKYDGDGYPRGERDNKEPPLDFYIYRDMRNNFYLGVKRTTDKQFPQFHWNGTQWVSGLPKGFLKIPYRLPELIDAPPDAWVVIASGEKDAETAARLGFAATTNPGGEGKGQWAPELNCWFVGKRHVAIMEDNDPTGYGHAAEVAQALRGVVPDIRIVAFRDLKLHADLTDWVDADRSRGHAELLAKIESSPAPLRYELIRASTIKMRAVQWWWPGHLACGELEILTGPPDIGKSQVHCSYVAHMTTGRDWPDGAKGPPPRHVVMLTAEDNTAHTVCPRLLAAGADLNRVLILNKIRKDNKNRMFLLQEDLDILEQILTNDPSIGLVTLDPITAYLGGKLDSHRATDVRNQLGPLKELAELTRVAFSAITHPAKRPGPKALDHYIGSQAFIAAPRIGHICIAEMEEDEHGKPRPSGRVLFATPKHNIFTAMPTIAYRLVTTENSYDAETGAHIHASRVEWAETVPLSADQAIAAGAPLAKGKVASGPVTFLLDMLANGPVAKTVIKERAKTRGFTEDQLRYAREKAAIVTYKDTGPRGKSFWAMPRHVPDNQRAGSGDATAEGSAED
jgi:DNA polymerase